MPDLQDYSFSQLGAANVNVPRVQIQGRITDSTTGATLADFTGANVLLFPAVWTTLSVDQRRKLANVICPMILMMRGGFDDGTGG